MKPLFLALLVLLCNFVTPAYSQSQTYNQSQPTGKPLLDLDNQSSNASSPPPPNPKLNPSPKAAITDDISAFFADKSVRRIGLLIVIIVLGYNRFKKKKLEERSKL